MIYVLHVVDETCDETAFQVLEVLCSRQSDEHFRHTVCSISGPRAATARAYLSTRVHNADRRLSRHVNWSPRLADIARESNADIVHAWGIEAAGACIARLGGTPLVLTQLDPGPTRDVAKWLRSFPRDAAVVAGSQVISSRMTAAGILPERIVVIRGPVDFKAITQARSGEFRDSLVGAGSPVVVLSGPASRAGGQYYGVWAAAIVRQILPDIRVILPYASRESERLLRFVRGIRMPSLLSVPSRPVTWAQLVSAADVFMIPALDETCTESVGWAMAAGVPVVGSAVRSVAELIADRSNGLLARPGVSRALAAKLLTALEDADLRRRIAEVARGQAYEVFGVRQFVDNYARLYDNVRSGKPAGVGIHDSAMVA
ncbi:MAG: glycosyltransferase family 4 protein [Planctomycetota bacterium]|nr:glycosyltransferase family 4 protein [Planctomycetota bacterium]